MDGVTLSGLLTIGWTRYGRQVCPLSTTPHHKILNIALRKNPFFAALHRDFGRDKAILQQRPSRYIAAQYPVGKSKESNE